jgi:hypothetical protein
MDIPRSPVPNSEHPTDIFTPRRKIHWPSVIQFALSLLAIAFLWSGSAIFAMMGLIGLVMRDPSAAQPAPGFMLAAGMALIGVLVVPSAFYALWRMLDNPVEILPRRLQHLGCSLWPFVALLVIPLVVLAGYAAIRYTGLDWLIIPPLHVLAIGLPIAVLLYFTIRNLPLGSLQRMWGVFGSGLVLAPALILSLEALALIAFMFLGIISIASQPQLVEQLRSLSQWLTTNEPSQEATLQAVAPYLFRPSVILSVLTFGAILVPLIEELIKPMGVWLLVGRNLYPSAGFAAGAISGAGYALFESLVLTSGTQDWASLVVARIGTSVVHIVTAAMTGWALVLAWQRRRYLILAGTYLLAVLMHGLWNAITLFFSFASLGEMQGVVVKLPPVFKLADAAPYALLALAVVGLLIMSLGNRRLTQTYRAMRAEKANHSQDTPPDDAPPDRVAEESML